MSGITASLLLCTFLSPLRAQDDVRTREELVKVCLDRLEEVKEGMQRWVSEGRSPHEVGVIMRDEFPPHMNGGRFREAEEVLDRALGILNRKVPIQKPKDLRTYLRKTEETQYLILPIREAGSVYGGRTTGLENGIERVVERIGKVEDVKKRNLGFHLIIPAWRFDPRYSENKRADIARAVRGAFDVAIAHNVAVHFTVETHEWPNRPGPVHDVGGELRGYGIFLDELCLMMIEPVVRKYLVFWAIVGVAIIFFPK